MDTCQEINRFKIKQEYIHTLPGFFCISLIFFTIIPEVLIQARQATGQSFGHFNGNIIRKCRMLEFQFTCLSGKGFAVIHAMVLHTLAAANVYGDSALAGRKEAFPLTTEGDDFDDSLQYDFWDHIDYVVDQAAKKGIYIGMMPIWGSNVNDI